MSILPSRRRRAIAAGLALGGLLLAGCGSSAGVGGRAGAGGTATNGGGLPLPAPTTKPTPTPAANPASLSMKAMTALPPGNSAFVSTAGQARGQATGNPADYGDHLDDQRVPYWSFAFKNGALGTTPGTPISPKSGTTVYFDGYGVPIVYAATLADAWYAAGYVAAQQRLFLMDAARRLATGRLAELTGCGGVPGDIQARTTGYTAAEYQRFYDRASKPSQDSVNGFVAGANAYLDVIAANPSLLPAEYQVLSTTPAKFTAADILAEGVLITRSVAAEGGNEFLNIKMLQGLEARYGKAEGRARFQDLVWQDDPLAVTTVPDAAGTFSNQATSPRGRDAVFATMADYATQLPDAIWKGDGTGDATSVCTSAPALSPPTLPVGSGAGVARVTPRLAPAAARLARERVRRTVAGLKAFRLHRGSFAFAIGGTRTRDGGGLLVSEPQLGYGYPSELWEIEIHVSDPANATAVRGSTVPGLPVVGIGYNANLAWGLTTGYTKTVESFIETLCTPAQQTAGTCKADQYYHQGTWKDATCRTETINYRPSARGVPVGPASLASNYHVCRTVHGPLVARADAQGLGRALAYNMWLRETDNIEGIRAWSVARNLADFRAAVATLTWNENATVATRDGDIAYYHPGLHPVRSAETDQRLPTPGTGAYDFAGWLPFATLPKAENPAQGYLANWNTKPAHGWLDGEGLGATSRPGGHNQRVTSLLDQLARGRAGGFTYADLFTIEKTAGTRDHRARDYRPLFAAFLARQGANLTDTGRTALDVVATWDGAAYDASTDPTATTIQDSVGATVFEALVLAVREELFADLRNVPIDPSQASTAPYHDAFARMASTGSHLYDASAMDNLALRLLDPGTSGLAVRGNFLGARSRDDVLAAALARALASLATAYNGGTALTPADLAKCRRTHPRSLIGGLTGVVGPSTTMPYLDRGSWIHLWGAEKP